MKLKPDFILHSDHHVQIFFDSFEKSPLDEEVLEPTLNLVIDKDQVVKEEPIVVTGRLFISF